MSAEHKINQLVSQAHHSDDPKELREIAKHLEDLSAWGEAKAARQKAAQLERKLAEVN